MNYSEIKDAFTAILNRRDITPSRITTFLSLGIQYIQRKLRVPPMEKLVEYTSDGTKLVPVPGDFLEMINIYVDDTSNGQVTLEKRDLQTVLANASVVGTPRFYHRSGSNFIVGPRPAADTVISVSYYQDAATLANDTDTNWMTEAIPSALIYAGLIYAADFYLDDRKKLWESRLLEDLSDVQEMANRDELVNGTVSPAYPHEDD